MTSGDLVRVEPARRSAIRNETADEQHQYRECVADRPHLDRRQAADRGADPLEPPCWRGHERHATLAERPYDTGDWADPVLRGYLYDTYERLRVEALSESAYAPIADRVEKVLGEEVS